MSTELLNDYWVTNTDEQKPVCSRGDGCETSLVARQAPDRRHIEISTLRLVIPELMLFGWYLDIGG
jgi:hypothetical protein